MSEQKRTWEAAYYCPCGLTLMTTRPPEPGARLVACTFRCRTCGEQVRPVPTAWDQP